MNIHTKFFEHIGTLPNGEKIQAVYRQYKTADENFAFELNGRLKSGLSIDEKMVKQFGFMKELICAKNTAPITLYRMTSDVEFSGPLLSAIEDLPIIYPAFLSTSESPFGLSKFVPSYGQPLLLEIECPSGTCMALMEAHHGAAENEFLLGCGTQFTVETVGFVNSDELALYLPPNFLVRNLKRLKLRVSLNPTYAGFGDMFYF